MNPRLLGWPLCLVSCWCGVAAILSGHKQERQEVGLVPVVPPQLVPVFIIAFVASLLNSLGRYVDTLAHRFQSMVHTLCSSRPPAASCHLRRPRPGCGG